MRFALVVLFCLALPLVSRASQPLFDFVSYECSPPFSLRDFKTHLARGDAAAAIDWDQIPDSAQSPDERLVLEIEHSTRASTHLNLFTWQRKDNEDFQQFRTVRGRSVTTSGHSAALYMLHDLSLTLWPNFGSVLGFDARLIVEGQGAVLLDHHQSKMALCKMTTLHVRRLYDTSMPSLPGFQPNYRALEPWLRELLKSDGFKQAMACGAHLAI